ncbi:hypothetical protein MCAMS1_02030 [biofilm metagenome]
MHYGQSHLLLTVFYQPILLYNQSVVIYFQDEHILNYQFVVIFSAALIFKYI